ncbi:MAG: hypothetical protein IIB73_03470 [Proteobacteria bacterium]|nr:hypothetical protein [Pseudomonadota bacterium]
MIYISDEDSSLVLLEEVQKFKDQGESIAIISERFREKLLGKTTKPSISAPATEQDKSDLDK